MNNLNNAINLYQNDRINKLEIDYKLSENKQEKQALRVAIIYLKQDKN